jgi:hypothetical protein
MNCVQRRVFRAFVRSGGDPNNPAQFAALMHYVQALVLTLPNKAGRVVDLMLRGDERTTYAAVAERLGISEGAARVDGWRGSSLLAEAILRGEWNQSRWREAPAQRPHLTGDRDLQPLASAADSAAGTRSTRPRSTNTH